MRRVMPGALARWRLGAGGVVVVITALLFMIASPVLAGPPIVPAPARPDYLIPPIEPTGPGDSDAPSPTQTSEFMAGKIVMSVLFVESSGGSGYCSPADPQTENWDAQRQAKVLSEITDGMSFWTTRANRPSPLSFVIDNLGTAPTSCEPINHTFSDSLERGKWIADALNAKGFPATPGTYTSVARSLVNARRASLGADWGVLVIIVDSLNDPDGQSPDGWRGSADLNGPMQYLSYDNGGWGIDRMNLVALHETGHSFGALDEYAGGCSTADSWGYLNVMNASCNSGGITTDTSVMGEGSELTDPLADVSTSARAAIGWRNPSGPSGRVVDVVRTSTVSVTPFVPDPTTDPTPTYSGVAGNQPFPPGACNTLGGICYRTPTPVTVSKVSQVEWRLDSGAWTNEGVVASDGAFDEEDVEAFTFTPTSPVANGPHTFSVRATNQFGDVTPPSGDTLGISSPTGSLRVVSNPALPAQILVDGVLRDSWGLTWLSLAPGEHSVAFTHVEGFSEPVSQNVTVADGQTTTVTGMFVQRGSLRVTTSPAVAGTVSVDGIPRNNWGMWTDVPVGSHQVCFGAVVGFTAPACQDTVVSAGQLSTVTGTYVVNAGAPGPSGVGQLRVTTSPALPAQILVDGVLRDSWGLTWLSLSPGQHTVSFTHIEGFSEPDPVSVSVVVGQITSVTGVFTKRGSLRVLTSPAVAGTVSLDGLPRNNWGMWTDVPPGTHEVCFGQVTGLTAPECQTVAVTAGSLTTVTGTYT